MMEKEVAASILTLALSFDETIGKLYDQVARITDDDVHKRFDAAVGNLMGFIARDIVFPIETMYPDLRPQA